jgi:DNA polymerase I
LIRIINVHRYYLPSVCFSLYLSCRILVCAFARKILLQAAKIAEQHRFRVLHGIVDSLWIKKKKENNDEKNNSGNNNYNYYDDYLTLKNSIEKETGFTVSFEGVYKLIAFTHSKTNRPSTLPNRYFGVFDDGSLKIRGLEARRHDTPILFSKCQSEILKITGYTPAPDIRM